MHGVFDIVGPVMIGPSSSHTAGAVRLGLMARAVLGELPVRADIDLAGSFAQTYRGHGTDKAIVAGILGFHPDDERIPEALTLAKRQGLDIRLQTTDLKGVHPNTAFLRLTGADGRAAHIQGASVGGGNILVSNIDGYEVALTGAYPALIIVHRDRPGVIARVTEILSRYGVNIAFMRVSRQNRGETAMMILEMDDDPSEDVVEECQECHDVEHAFRIPSI